VLARLPNWEPFFSLSVFDPVTTFVTTF